MTESTCRCPRLAGGTRRTDANDLIFPYGKIPSGGRIANVSGIDIEKVCFVKTHAY